MSPRPEKPVVEDPAPEVDPAPGADASAGETLVGPSGADAPVGPLPRIGEAPAPEPVVDAPAAPVEVAEEDPGADPLAAVRRPSGGGTVTDRARRKSELAARYPDAAAEAAVDPEPAPE